MTVHPRARWNQLTDKDREKILKLSDYGVTAKDISKRIGVGLSSVRDYLAKSGRANRRTGRGNA